jgi:hypothetical protein
MMHIPRRDFARPSHDVQGQVMSTMHSLARSFQ